MFIKQLLDFYNSVLQECIWEAEVELSVNAIKVASKETLEDRLVFSVREQKSNEHSVLKDRKVIGIRFHEKNMSYSWSVVRIWLLLSFSAMADISLLSSVLCLDFLRTTGRRFKWSPPEEADATKGLSLLNPKEYFFRFTEVFGGNDAMIIFRLIKEDNCLSSEKAALDYLQPCSKV